MDYCKILVDLLYLDEGNPRLDLRIDEVSQADILGHILSNDQDKLLKLAEDISEDGLIESQLILVCKQGDKHVVKDGNRRISCLKLMKRPDLIVDENIRNKFMNYGGKCNKELLERVLCAVTDDEEQADKMVMKLHSGAQHGVGQLTWDAQMKDRYQVKMSGKRSRWEQFKDAFMGLDDVPESYKQSLGRVKKTNLERALSGDEISNVIGVMKNKDDIEIEKCTKALLIFMEKLINNRINVNDVRNQSDRERFAERLRAEARTMVEVPRVEVEGKFRLSQKSKIFENCE